MDQKFFRVPFASVGDRQTIPDVAPTNGSVSYPSGWGPDYAKDPGADASAKPVEREAMNAVLNAITGAIRQYQTNGYPEWITTANNNGAAFGYDAGVVVDYNGVMYLSLVSNNTATPGADATKWQLYIQREATRLLIANNLSEIAASGGEAQSDARENLGLGALATKDALTATDTGAVPQDTQSLGTADLNAVVSPGRKFQSLTGNATTERHYPVSLAGMLDVIRTTETGIRQIYYPYNTTDVYHRYCEDATATTPVFSGWALNGAGGYLEAGNNLSDVADAATARQNIGVSYTLSTDAAPADASGYAAGHIWYQVEES